MYFTLGLFFLRNDSACPVSVETLILVGGPSTVSKHDDLLSNITELFLIAWNMEETRLVSLQYECYYTILVYGIIKLTMHTAITAITGSV